MEGFWLYSSYQDAVGIDGEAIQFEWTNFPGFSSLSILGEIQQDLEKRRIQPEEFTDRIIFLSMFDDIARNTNDDNCVWNVEKVKNYAHSWVQARKRSGMEHHAQKGQWNCTAAKMVQRFKEIGHLAFKSLNALSRGILKQKKGKTSIHFNGDSMNTELLFQTMTFCKSAQCLRSSNGLV